MSSISVRPSGRAGSGTTDAQWYRVSTWHGEGTRSAPSPATSASTSGAVTPMCGATPRLRLATTNASPPTTSRPPVPKRITLVGTYATRTNPVRKVARIAPSVLTPDSRPTTDPVSVSVDRTSLTTIGGTADRTAAGTNTVTVTTSRAIGAASPGPAAAVASRIAGVTRSTNAPPISSNGPIIDRGGSRSAAAPPDHAPKAIAVRARPITAVFVSRVMPTYGAMSRSEVISRTSTAADVPNTRA